MDVPAPKLGEATSLALLNKARGSQGNKCSMWLLYVALFLLGFRAKSVLTDRSRTDAERVSLYIMNCSFGFRRETEAVY